MQYFRAGIVVFENFLAGPAPPCLFGGTPLAQPDSMSGTGRLNPHLAFGQSTPFKTRAWCFVPAKAPPKLNPELIP